MPSERREHEDLVERQNRRAIVRDAIFALSLMAAGLLVVLVYLATIYNDLLTQ